MNAQDEINEIDRQIRELNDQRKICVKKRTKERGRVMNSLETGIYESIKNGTFNSPNTKAVHNALTRLRRTGLIRNEGSRSQPKWFVQ